MKKILNKTITLLQFIVGVLLITVILVEGCENITKLQEEGVKLKRGKRYLDFVQKSRMFFRANIKNNMLRVNQLWAYASGFRANYPIENDKEHRPFRRDVYETIEHLMDHHGFDGKACVLKSFCEASKEIAPKSGILFKIFKLIFKLNEGDRKHFSYLKEENCEQLFHEHCPLTFDNIVPYTDL